MKTKSRGRASGWRLLAASIGVGLLLKGLIAAVFPVAAAVSTCYSPAGFHAGHLAAAAPVLRPALLLAIAAPWHVLATIRNPPASRLHLTSEPGHYHGFFWFYFLNEHVFRFLDMR